MPKTSSVNSSIIAARALTEALTNPASAALFAQFGNAQQQAIVNLAEIFEIAIAKPAPPSIVRRSPTACSPDGYTAISAGANSPRISEGDSSPSISKGKHSFSSSKGETPPLTPMTEIGRAS